MINLQAIYDLYLSHPVITTDSRHTPSGSIFFALKGKSFNGNLFARQAIEDGCSYAFVDDEKFADEKQIFFVEDSLKTLQLLANYHRKHYRGKVIGITGTNGKTTTKELIAAVLSKKYEVLYTQGNLNNHIGVPLTLLRLADEHDIAVIEMGANHCGEIKELCDIVEPDFGIITNVAKGHLEGFGSFEGVLRTKGELYDAIRSKQGTIFVKHENNFLQEMANGLEKIEYGEAPGLFVSGQTKESQSPYLSFEWKAEAETEYQAVTTNLIGDYNIENALAAIAIGLFFEVDPKRINEAISSYIPQNNRSQLKKTAKNTLIIDAYNANPSSMQAALKNFEKMSLPHKALVLGDMLELGSETEKEHQYIVDQIKKSHFEKVFLIGEHFNATKNTFLSFLSQAEFIEYLESNPLDGYAILMKGSRSSKLEQLIDYL